MNLLYSIIIPVYNRPNEIDELLDSLTKQDFTDDFEVLLIEDGSTIKSNIIAEKYKNQLHLKYFFKENSGAGASRNFGMENALGTYFIILDSDVIVPEHYLSEVKKGLDTKYTDAFGGPDAAHVSFTPLQKAINYAMTSMLTTGGIRGKKQAFGKFQPRSFNFGVSKLAFVKTNGFSNLKIGEDIDLTFRLWENGFDTQLISNAFVYHKRRSSLPDFFNQTYKFGKARPFLNQKYPKSAKLTYWFPSIFLIGFDIGVLLAIFGFSKILTLYGIYFIMIFIDSLFQNSNIKVAFLSIITTFTQFLGYGFGFLESYVSIKFTK